MSHISGLAWKFIERWIEIYEGWTGISIVIGLIVQVAPRILYWHMLEAIPTLASKTGPERLIAKQTENECVTSYITSYSGGSIGEDTAIRSMRPPLLADLSQDFLEGTNLRRKADCSSGKLSL